MVDNLFFLVFIAILAIIFGPLLSIWALNTLFPVLAIPYTAATWFAMLVLGGGLGGFFKGLIGSGDK